MTEQALADESLEQDEHARQQQEHGERDGSENGHAEGETEGDEGTHQRPRRPGKLERRLAAAERLAAEARAEAEAHRQQAQHYARQLAEASEAGNRFAQDGIKSRLDRAEDTLRNAIHAGDADAVVKANRQIAELSAMQAQMSNAPRQPAYQPPAAPASPTYTPSTAAWLAANPWYGRDPELTSVAKAAHAAARRQGIEVDTPEYWRFVERGVETMAPGTIRTRGTAGQDDDEDDAPQRRAPAARPPSRSAPTTRTNATTPPSTRGEINLTAEEADAAKISGMTPQEYKSWQTKLRASGRLTAGAR